MDSLTKLPCRRRGGVVVLGMQNSPLTRSAHLLTVRAFTLIEILVVIAIIGILAALVIPAVRGVVDSGRATKSLSNLKQIGVAIAAYGGDNNGTIPPHHDPDNAVIPGNGGASYARFLAPYTTISGHNTIAGLNYNGQPNAFVNGKRPPGIFASPNSTNVVALASYETDYGYNQWASRSDKYRYINRVPRRSKLLAVADTSWANINFAAGTSSLTNRYRGKATVLYFDFHAELADSRDTNIFQKITGDDYPWSVPPSDQ
jgi:prepilin-type N-terminal cleavage/methylation domain-containing protein